MTETQRTEARIPALNNRTEMRVYGRNAVLAVFEERPDDIVKLQLTEDLQKPFARLMKYLAAKKRAYHIVKDEDLKKITETDHHGGVAIICKRPAKVDLAEFLGHSKKIKSGFVLVLDKVENPHNLGAILRTAAHFGCLGVLTNCYQMASTPSSIRTAEGGFEYVTMVDFADSSKLIPSLKEAGFTVVATSSDSEKASEDLDTVHITGKVAVFIGEEQFGLRNSVLESADRRVQIQGTGNVESLNASVAAGILMAHFR